jgi:PilZ domain
MSPRHRADMRIRLVLATPMPVVLHARASDISVGGVSIVLPQEAIAGSVAMLGIKAHATEGHVWFRVRLRYRSGFRCGFQFLDTTGEQRTLIRRLCGSMPN